METMCPDRRLNYIVEGVKLEGGLVIGYERQDEPEPGWVVHVAEPTYPDIAVTVLLVPDANLDDAHLRYYSRAALVSRYKMAHMN